MAIAAILMASVAAASGVHVDERVVHYAVTGPSIAELHRQMRALGPADPVTGKRMQGFAEWSVSWTFGFQERSGACRIADPRVDLTVVITLPQWTGQAPSPRLATSWQTFVDGLVVHEHGHRDIGIGAANAVQAALESMAPQHGGCAGFADAVNHAAKATLDGFKGADREYDRHTRHGQLQGVELK